jgi:hypothetical protein
MSRPAIPIEIDLEADTTFVARSAISLAFTTVEALMRRRPRRAG